jgi:hypothetical protein
MRMLPPRIGLSIILTLPGVFAAAAEEGFVPLVRGDDPKQFELVGFGPESLKITEGEVRLSGIPFGYFALNDTFRNYVLRFDWKYERPSDLKVDAKFDGNSGLLLHVQKPHKIWPKSIEVQLFYPDAGHILPILGAKFDGARDAGAQKRAGRSVGEWNEVEVTCRDGAITCTINGEVIDRGTRAEPDRGQIGWQAEGASIRFRKIRIKRLD